MEKFRRWLNTTLLLAISIELAYVCLVGFDSNDSLSDAVIQLEYANDRLGRLIEGLVE